MIDFIRYTPEAVVSTYKQNGAEAVLVGCDVVHGQHCSQDAKDEAQTALDRDGAVGIQNRRGQR